jgi:hypothetical protein
MAENAPAWLDLLSPEEPLPGEPPTDPSTIVVLTNRAGVVAATLRFAGHGREYTGARGGDMHLRALLVELFHHRTRVARSFHDRPFSRLWLGSHLHVHLHAIAPDLTAHTPVFGDHPVLRHVFIGKPLPPGLMQRLAPGSAPA